MRAPFDTTCDLIYGPGGLSPGTVYATGVCRFVPLSPEDILLDPLDERQGYITMEFAIPNQPGVVNSNPLYAVNYDESDLIAIPTGSVPQYQVLFVERMTYRTHPVYYRVHVRFAP